MKKILTILLLFTCFWGVAQPLRVLTANDYAKKIKEAKPKGKFKDKGFEIEIISVDTIEGGIEVYAKAWKDKKPVGFGADSTVEIERFRFFGIETSMPDTIESKKIQHLKKDTVVFKDDPTWSLKSDLLNAIKLTSKGGDKIIKRKIGHTTDTYYPDSDPEINSVDGHCNSRASSPGVPWADLYYGSYNLGASDNETTVSVKVQASEEDPNWEEITRGIVTFYTENLPDNAEISSAILSLYSGVGASGDELSMGFEVNIYQGITFSNTSIGGNRFVYNTYTTAFSSNISTTTWGSSGYKDFTLNSSGISNISKTGVSKFAVKSNIDVNNSPPSWQYGMNAYVGFNTAETSGTASDPKLVITYTTPSTGWANDMNGLNSTNIGGINGLNINNISTVNGR